MGRDRTFPRELAGNFPTRPIGGRIIFGAFVVSFLLAEDTNERNGTAERNGADP